MSSANRAHDAPGLVSAFSRNTAVVLFTTFVCFCTLYTPQPLFPLFAGVFAVEADAVSLLVTATLVPLAVAPIFYGYFLQAVPAKTMLVVAVSLLALNQFMFLFAGAFWHLLTLRFIQGLLLPAIFTALMTYCSSMSDEKSVRKMMGLYVATTILGGFCSRLFAGVIADVWGWQWVFLLTAGTMLLSLILLSGIDADAELSFDKLNTKAIGRVWSKPFYRYGYRTLFFVFFVFSGILNLLPFRLGEIDPGIKSAGIALMYTGYLIGIPIAIASERIVAALGGTGRALGLGIFLNMVGLVAYLMDDTGVIFAMMFCFSAGMFFIHATLSGLVNYRAVEHKGVVNGLYVSVYYASGALGSWIPALLYQKIGWRGLMIVLMIMLAGGIDSMIKMNRHRQGNFAQATGKRG